MKTISSLCLAGLFLVTGCDRISRTVSGPLPQRGYLWQRAWTPAVSRALTEAHQHLNSVVLLGAEIEWDEGQPRVVRANIAWEQVTSPCAIALRVGPVPEPSEKAIQAIAQTAKSILAEAVAHDVAVEEFQLDYDCAQKKLAGYRAWLPRVRAAVQPARFVITTLPSWLEEKEFARLIGEADGYVLQIHSVPAANAGRIRLCDPAAARRWVAQAAKLHRPFAVALPTYRCTAGYDVAGKLLGVAMDSVQPAWPPQTRRFEFAADADEIADLVKEWQRQRPAELRELIWYRIPVATDARNWRWATLSAVMAGRKPERRFEIVRNGDNPVDLSLRNTGESDDDRPAVIVASWTGGNLIASDGLSGWNVRSQKQSATFSVTPGQRLRLPPGAERRIGWLRHATPVNLEFAFENENGLAR